MTNVLDFGYVKIADPEDENVWGSDANIIRAARMSTNKGFLGWGPIHESPEVCRLHPDYCQCKLKPGDEKLLRYLYEHKHDSPFEFAGAVFEVQAPIFVIREWQRHRSIAVSEELSFNEMSARYTSLPDLYYVPSVERLMHAKQDVTNKQSSAPGWTKEEAKYLQGQISAATERCREAYELLLVEGVSREIARLVVPVNQYSRMRVSANLRGWLAFLTLRLGAGAQHEISVYAEAIADIIKEQFPRTHALFRGSV